MGQDPSLDKQISIEGTLLMLDGKTPHVAVPVQVIYEGEAVETTLSDDAGRYQFANLKPGKYQVRCHVLGGYAHYGEGGSIVNDLQLDANQSINHGNSDIGIHRFDSR